MDFKLISEYWAQVTLLLGAIGYIVKSVTDYRYKKKEIWHGVWAQGKLEKVLLFYSNYQKLSIKLSDAALVFSVLPLDTAEFDKIYLEVNELLNEFELSRFALMIFANKSQSSSIKTVSDELNTLHFELSEYYSGLMQTGYADFKKLHKKSLDCYTKSHDILYSLNWSKY